MATLAGVLATNAGRCPDRLAIVFDDRSYTYRELDGAVNALATQLLRLPTGALGAQKACLEFGLRHELPAALENEMQELIQGFAREDWHEAIRAFAGKRSPCFTGR